MKCFSTNDNNNMKTLRVSSNWMLNRKEGKKIAMEVTLDNFFYYLRGKFSFEGLF